MLRDRPGAHWPVVLSQVWVTGAGSTCGEYTNSQRDTSIHPFLLTLSTSSPVLPQRCELCPHKDGALKRTDSGGKCGDATASSLLFYVHFAPCLFLYSLNSLTSLMMKQQDCILTCHKSPAGLFVRLGPRCVCALHTRSAVCQRPHHGTHHPAVCPTWEIHQGTDAHKLLICQLLFFKTSNCSPVLSPFYRQSYICSFYNNLEKLFIKEVYLNWFFSRIIFFLYVYSDLRV